MAAAVDASSVYFQFYKMGIITADKNCGRSLNHAIVIVGFNEGSEAEEVEETEDQNTECIVERWYHDCPANSPVQERRRMQSGDSQIPHWII